MTRRPQNSRPYYHTSNRLHFLTTDFTTISTKQEASTVFITLVNFIMKGNSLDNASSERACMFLQSLTPFCSSLFNSPQIFHELVPSQDGTSQRFVEHLIPLLTCGCTDIVQSTLELVTIAMLGSRAYISFEFVESGFYFLLPPHFYEQETLLSIESWSFFIQMVYSSLSYAVQNSLRDFMLSTNISQEEINHTLTEMLFKPLLPFWHFVSQNRFKLKDSGDSCLFPLVVGIITRIAPLNEQATSCLLTSPLSFLATFWLSYFTTTDIKFKYLCELYFGMQEWSHAGQTVRLRSRTVLKQLKEDGLVDDVENHFQMNEYHADRRQYVSIAQLIPLFGGNNAVQLDQ